MIGSGRSLPRAFWVLWAGTALNQVGNALIIPFLAVYLTLRLHTGPAGVGAVLALQGAAQVAASFLGGQLADRMGRKWTMVGSLAAAAFATAALGLTGTALWVVALLVLRGLVLPLYGPASTAMVADIVPAEDAYGAFGLTRMGSNVGFMVGPAIGAFMAASGTLAGYRLLFLLSAGILMLYAFVTVFFLHETQPARRTSPSLILQPGPVTPSGADASLAARGRGRLGLPDLWVFLVALAALGLLYSQLYWVLPNYMSLDLHMASARFGYLASENALVIVVLSLPVLRLTRSWKPALNVARGAVLWAIGFGLVVVCHSLVDLLFPVAIISLGEILVNPGATAYVAAHAPPHRRGRMLSWVNVANRAGSALGPLAGGLALARVGSFGPWIGGAALGVLAAYAMTRVARHEPGGRGFWGRGPRVVDTTSAVTGL